MAMREVSQPSRAMCACSRGSFSPTSSGGAVAAKGGLQILQSWILTLVRYSRRVNIGEGL